jgi:sec-independent protein translocase protein TatC
MAGVILLYLLSRLGIVQPKFLAKQRRWAIVLAFVLGAIITPTFDPLNQTLVAVPLIVLYEMGTQLSKLAWKQRGKETANLVPKE